MTEKLYGWGLPVDISTHGWEIDRLIWIIHIFMLVLFVGWFIFLVATLVKFRARPGHKADYHVKHFKVPTYLEVAIALFEVLLLAGFSVPLFYNSRNERAMPSRNEAVEVRVIAEQFAWNVHYPGDDGLFGKTDVHLVSPTNLIGLDPNDPAGKDDITMVNQLHVPVNQPVIVNLSSKDVIHSFFIPVMRVKQDVIPGMVIPTWFQAKRTGQFEIACAQLCGLGHYRMRGFFFVKTAEEFKAWLSEMKPKPAPEPIVLAPTSVTPGGAQH